MKDGELLVGSLGTNPKDFEFPPGSEPRANMGISCVMDATIAANDIIQLHEDVSYCTHIHGSKIYLQRFLSLAQLLLFPLHKLTAVRNFAPA